MKYFIRVFISIALSIMVTSCCSNSIQKKEDSMEYKQKNFYKLKPDINLAPGTARINATISETDTYIDSSYLYIVVDEVIAYGSATPPIAQGKKLQLIIPLQIIEDNPVDLLKQNNKREMDIKFFTIPQNKSYWQLIQMKKLE